LPRDPANIKARGFEGKKLLRFRHCARGVHLCTPVHTCAHKTKPTCTPVHSRRNRRAHLTSIIFIEFYFPNKNFERKSQPHREISLCDWLFWQNKKLVKKAN